MRAGYPVMESQPRQCRANGRTFVESGNQPQPQPNIVVTEPRANQEVGLPLTIKGEARVFENTFSYRLRNADGSTLVEGFGTANAPDIGQYGPFTVTLNYPRPTSSAGTVEVFNYSARDGSEENKVSIPVRFQNVASATVKVFFGSRTQDPNGERCAQVYAVDRRIPQTAAVARAAVEELLRGPSVDERARGYFTNINDGVEIRGVTILNGTATVDLSETVQQNVGGSCRVQAIRAQLTETLKQFPTVQRVVIAVNGRTDDILQP